MISLFTLIIGFSTVCLNFYVTAIGLKRKKSWGQTIAIFLSITILYITFTVRYPDFPLKKQLYLIFLLPIFLMFEGHAFHKLYIFFTVVLRCGLISSAVGFILQWILPYGTDFYIQVYILAILVAYGIYVVIARRYARVFYEKLFTYTNQKEWALYTLGLLLTYNAFRFLYFGKGILPQKIIEDPLSYSLVFFASISSFSILCYAIIKTHENTTAEYNLQLTKNIIATDQEHYKKLHEQRQLVSILQHDYKYQINAVHALLQGGERAEAEALLAQFQQQFEEQTLPSFCENAVVNAQIGEFYVRCKNRGISFETSLSLPYHTSIDNFELCILLGNLLENAWDACTQPGFTGDKWISITVKFTSAQLAVRVQNSFDGIVERCGETITSRKNGEGLGIKSISAIAERYGGDYLPEWDEKVYTAYVLLNLRGET